jgi:hypothetical protein
MAEPRRVDIYIVPDGHVITVDVVLKRVPPPGMAAISSVTSSEDVPCDDGEEDAR